MPDRAFVPGSTKPQSNIPTVDLPVNVGVIKCGSELILYDTGWKQQDYLKMTGSDHWAPLPDQLKVLGFNAADVTKVVIGHAHWDHAGQLSDLPERRALCPTRGAQGDRVGAQLSGAAHPGDQLRSRRLQSYARLRLHAAYHGADPNFASPENFACEADIRQTAGGGRRQGLLAHRTRLLPVFPHGSSLTVPRVSLCVVRLLPLSRRHGPRESRSLGTATRYPLWAQSPRGMRVLETTVAASGSRLLPLPERRAQQLHQVIRCSPVP